VRLTFKHSYAVAAIIACLLVAYPRMGMAASILTESEITQFIEKTTDVINGHARDMSSDDIERYLKKHLHKDARFSSGVKYKIPGFPDQSASVVLMKQDFIRNVQQGSQALDDYETDVSIDQIKISKDGSKATVRTTGYESGSMNVQGAGIIPVEGTSKCLQILMLTKNTIQMYSANCETNIQFKQN